MTPSIKHLGDLLIACVLRYFTHGRHSMLYADHRATVGQVAAVRVSVYAGDAMSAKSGAVMPAVHHAYGMKNMVQQLCIAPVVDCNISYAPHYRCSDWIQHKNLQYAKACDE